MSESLNTTGVIAMTQVLTPATSPARWKDAEQCAARYGFSKRHWLRLVDAGKAPQGTKFGRLIRWADDILNSWDDAGCPPTRHVSAKGGRA